MDISDRGENLVDISPRLPLGHRSLQMVRVVDQPVEQAMNTNTFYVFFWRIFFLKIYISNILCHFILLFELDLQTIDPLPPRHLHPDPAARHFSIKKNLEQDVASEGGCFSVILS